MTIELKVKARTLAAEARIIRGYERAMVKKHAAMVERRRAKSEDEQAVINALHGHRVAHLRNHRCTIVRREARSTHLARAFLKGMPYHRVEDVCYTKPDFDEVERMALHFGADHPGEQINLKQKFAEWVSEFKGTFHERVKGLE